METTAELGGAWRTGPAYTVAQAGKLSGLSPATIRRWLRDDGQSERRREPAPGQRRTTAGSWSEISFLDLAEIVVVAAFRRNAVKLTRLRRAHEFACRSFAVAHPFALRRFKTDGAQALLEFEQREPQPGQPLLTANSHGRFILPSSVDQALDQFDFEDELAARWYPAGRDVPIVVDPRFAAGRPSIPDRGVTLAMLHQRWKSGQSIDFIARDYKLRPDTVEAALQHADTLAS